LKFIEIAAHLADLGDAPEEVDVSSPLQDVIDDETHHIHAEEFQFDVFESGDIQKESENFALFILDLETTGGLNQNIVQIGAWEMLTHNIFESLVKPGNMTSCFY
jgi:hypothetical protein